MESKPDPITLCYKHINGKLNSVPILLDVYLPPLSSEGVQGLRSQEPRPLAAVVYFHGGGLTVGNRQSWFPVWLYKRAMALGYAFISPDYQLLPPATAHDIVKDIEDLFSFLSETKVNANGQIFTIDTKRIAVSGSSAGGFCAYLAAAHCSPRPKAVVSLYGMGGDLLTPHYLYPKDKVFLLGREILDTADFAGYLYPFKSGDEGLKPITESPLAYHPKTYRIPGYPANPRMLLCRLYLQLGTFMDYFTGMHEPSISRTLREILNKEDAPSQEIIKVAIPEEHHNVFPQFLIDQNWPATMLLHGTADTAVLFKESQHMKTLLEQANIPVELVTFQGKEHSFDYEANAQEIWKEQFDGVEQFLLKHLGSED